LSWLKSITAPREVEEQDAPSSSQDNARRFGLTADVVDKLGGFASLQAAFPGVEFSTVGADWASAQVIGLDVLVTATGVADLTEAMTRIRSRPRNVDIIVALAGGGLDATRTLLRAGAADVIAQPVTESALGLSIERMLTQLKPAETARAKAPGRITAFLKAGGGVGATSLCLLSAMQLARKKNPDIAVADFDLQGGAVAAQLGLPEAFTVRDLFAAGAAIEDTPFARALQAHTSGIRVLASPGEFMPMEAITPVQVDAVTRGLRREFSHIFLDLPGVWSAWTHRMLQQADRIVLVTQMSVPRINVARRQLKFLAEEGLSHKPLTLVCNAVAPDQSSKLPLKWAEKPLARPFDVVLPEDRRSLEGFVNEGLLPAERGPSAKFYAAVQRLAEIVGETPATALTAG
jgi:pilus assembly protein CpaE